MVTSKCGSCEGTEFEMVQQDDVRGSRYKLMFVQCASCGAVVGVTTHEHIPTLIHGLTGLVNALIARIR